MALNMAEIPSCRCPSNWSYGPRLVGYLENSSQDLGKMKPFWPYSTFQMARDHHLENRCCLRNRIHRVHVGPPFGILRRGSLFESLFLFFGSKCSGGNKAETRITVFFFNPFCLTKVFFRVWVFSPLKKVGCFFFELEGNQGSSGFHYPKNACHMGISSVLVQVFPSSLLATSYCEWQPTKE